MTVIFLSMTLKLEFGVYFPTEELKKYFLILKKNKSMKISL